MLKAFKDFIDNQLSAIEGSAGKDSNAERGYQFAAAMLLLEMTRADFDVKTVELDAVSNAIKQGFSLNDAQTHTLVELAESEIDHATCLYEFTRRINDELSIEKKGHLVELLWRVAYADGELDKYEENFVRKIAELLHVRHRPMIRAKHRAEAQLREENA